jgi:hypothetical protein
MKISEIMFIFISITIFLLCCNTPEESYESPIIISGKVHDDNGLPIANAAITLSTLPNFEAVFSGTDGSFTLKDFPQGKYRIKAAHLGFEVYESDVPKPVSGNSYIDIILLQRTYYVPAAKPLSKGSVRINNKILEIDPTGNGIYQKFLVKGAAYSPTPIGGGTTPQKISDRSIDYLKQMNANTIRTYSGVNKYFLLKAADNGIYVIVSFWVDYALDLSNEDNRKKVIDDFAKMVLDLKDYPSVLMWNIGNEQNYQNGNSKYWYSLVQELAVTAYNLEGERYHPVCANNGNILNIGNSEMKAEDASLTYMDLWAINIYEWDFTPTIQKYKTKTQKPIVLTEWGIDALDNRTKKEYEDVQASFDSTNWTQIIGNGDICLGGTVFEFTDEWWKDSQGNSQTHDYGGYQTGSHPDGYSNEEWWGVIAVSPDNNGDGFDEWRPRSVFYTLSKLWK